MKQHAIEILEKRIRNKLSNDGKQTPLKGYPIFIAQHATATCCRKCINKWYKIPENKMLSNEEIEFLSNMIIEWIKQQIRMWDINPKLE